MRFQALLRFQIGFVWRFLGRRRVVREALLDAIALSRLACRVRTFVGHDSQRNNEDATDDGAHAAGQPGQGDGVGQFLPDDVTTPQKAPN
ncbi:MAG: hypothetical protein ACXWO1_15220, partial [Isosphaeraceae bacterium]